MGVNLWDKCFMFFLLINGLPCIQQYLTSLMLTKLFLLVIYFNTFNRILRIVLVPRYPSS